MCVCALATVPRNQVSPVGLEGPGIKVPGGSRRKEIKVHQTRGQVGRGRRSGESRTRITQTEREEGG